MAGYWARRASRAGVVKLAGVELLVEPGVEADLADGFEIAGAGAEGEAVEGVEDALVAAQHLRCGSRRPRGTGCSGLLGEAERGGHLRWGRRRWRGIERGGQGKTESEEDRDGAVQRFHGGGSSIRSRSKIDGRRVARQ